MRSVERQTLAEQVEHIIVPDYVGYGVGPGLYGRLPWYSAALRGEYIHLLCDDDELVSDQAVEYLHRFAVQHDYPAVITVTVEKNGNRYPTSPHAAPECGHVDLGSFIVRSDIWRWHRTDYLQTYEGDFHFAKALWDAGHKPKHMDFLFLRGGANHGRGEY